MNERYNPKGIEDKWYQHWMAKDYFSSTPDEREPYAIVIPPPNVTGVLHMGHMLNNTIQDILIRKARLEGKNACWVPGTDHASIATEAKVVKLLREKGIKKTDIGREEFLKHAFEWKDKYGGIILDQLKKLGASCDWNRTRFTMEEKLSKAVIEVFVDLHKKGKIYRGLRMVNWDPIALTALSNEEVIHKMENSRLFFIRYKIEGDPMKLPHLKELNDKVAALSDTMEETRNKVACKINNAYDFAKAFRKLQVAKNELDTKVEAVSWVTIATTRPETIFGDTAIAVNPDDERYAHLQGKRVIIPMVNRSVPVIFDKYVETDFGTGCLKVTPAHDMNDFDIGERHNLESIDIFNDDGTMSEAAQFFVGEDRFDVRKKMVKELKEMGRIVKIETHQNKVGRSERTDAVVEPRLKLQWWLTMKAFSATALKAVEDGEVTFHPPHMINMYDNWLREENVRDWCISRQLWWGQQIPAYYHEDEIYVATTREGALEQAHARTGNVNLHASDLIQDEDVMDTWFSSWLWPISVFDGFENQEELKYYYPTNTLVTGWDIMFFWVARMIMSGYEYSEELLGTDFVKENGKQPFQDVYFTGMVRDNKRRKMSKSLGNSPDALQLIENYGADGVRFGMLSSGAAGNDIIFDAPIDPETGKTLNESKLCGQGLNFCNKMWNALRLLKGWEIVDQPVNDSAAKINALAVHWFDHKFNQTMSEVEESMKTFRLSEALMSLYNFIWGDFCSQYLEMVKPVYGEPIDRATYEKTIYNFERLMTALHPFMPFVTEEIWHQIKDRKDGEDCVISPAAPLEAFDAAMIKQVDTALEVITKLRDTRTQNGIKMKDAIKVFVEESASSTSLFALDGLTEMVQKRGNLSELAFTKEEVPNSVSFLAGTEKYFIEMANQTIDVEAERARLTKELVYQEGFVQSISKKLSNERFVNNAPPAVVDNERKKMADGEAKIKILKEGLEKLG